MLTALREFVGLKEQALWLMSQTGPGDKVLHLPQGGELELRNPA